MRPIQQGARRSQPLCGFRTFAGLRGEAAGASPCEARDRPASDAAGRDAAFAALRGKAAGAGSCGSCDRAGPECSSYFLTSPNRSDALAGLLRACLRSPRGAPAQGDRQQDRAREKRQQGDGSPDLLSGR